MRVRTHVSLKATEHRFWRRAIANNKRMQHAASNNNNDDTLSRGTKSTHGTLVSLLDELSSLQVSNNSSTCMAMEEDGKDARLLKRVTLLHDALHEFGFQQECIEDILVHTRASGLEEALDWACLHVATQQLPAFLTDQDAVVDSMLTLQDPHRLDVVVTTKNKAARGTDRVREGWKRQVVSSRSSKCVGRAEESGRPLSVNHTVR